MLKVTIDNQTIEVPIGTTILEAARKIEEAKVLNFGLTLDNEDNHLSKQSCVPPAMCYYSKLSGTGGKCRVCLVKVTQGSAKDPRPMPKLVASCHTSVMDGMVVENNLSKEVLDARAGVVEFLLINHPLDCPVCDQAGECDLQNLAYKHGLSKTRYEFKRRTFVKKDIGDNIKLHMTRCILCYRCTTLADSLTNERVHGVLNRGDVAEISTYIEKAIDNDFSGNMIDVCPVGALTDKTFRFKSRVWFTDKMDAQRNCNKCSGKVMLWIKGEEILRVSARKDEWGEVKDFICDECRFKNKKMSDWTNIVPTHIKSSSVLAQNHYEKTDLQLLNQEVKRQINFQNGKNLKTKNTLLNPLKNILENTLVNTLENSLSNSREKKLKN